MSNYLKHSLPSRTSTPQSVAIPGRESEMAENNAGGVAFTQDDWARLRSWLILGSEGGTYYVTQEKLTAQNAACAVRCVKEDGQRAVQMAVQVSTAGLAPKNDQAIFLLALAIVHGDRNAKAFARPAVPQICRTGTHLFQLVGFLDAMGGWGPAKRHAVAAWYLAQTAENLAYQMVKYQSREAWSHHDVMHVAHPRFGKNPVDPRNRLAQWAKTGTFSPHGWYVGRDEVQAQDPLRLVAAFEGAKHLDERDGENALVNLITHHGLTREMVPPWGLTRKEVWAALLVKMPITAMIRNLPTMTRVGVLGNGPFLSEDEGHLVVSRLRDRERLRRGRVHPMQLLVAQKTYEAGVGRSDRNWEPIPAIVAALEEAFYLSFETIEPSNKRTLVAIDVSGSMASPPPGIPSCTCSEIAAVMAMVSLRTEPNAIVRGFSGYRNDATYSSFRFASSSNQEVGRLIDLGITAKDSLKDAARKAQLGTGGGTDCSLPMIAAREGKWPVDTFQLLTDNETWAGNIHPTQALAQFRQSSGLDARSVVVGMASNGFTIADPRDPRQLDVIGFDPGVPALIARFSAGFPEQAVNPLDQDAGESE